MDSRVLLSLVVVCFITAPLYAEPIAASKPKLDPQLDSEQQAIKVLREWSEACQTFTSVRGDFLRIEYEDVFQVQKHAKGQFGYLGPRHGFWQSGPPNQKPDTESLKKNARGESYKYKDAESDQWRWQKTQLIRINEDEKNYEEFIFPNEPNKPKQPKNLMQRIAWFVYYILYEMTADGISPFVPGIPNQSKYNDFLKNCQFKVCKETETHICITGKPINRMESNLYSEFKLHLEKKPWRLRATQYTHPGGNQQTVYLFSNIEMNPPEWDEPDLTGYQNLSKKYENSFK